MASRDGCECRSEIFELPAVEPHPNHAAPFHRDRAAVGAGRLGHPFVPDRHVNAAIHSQLRAGYDMSLKP